MAFSTKNISTKLLSKQKLQSSHIVLNKRFNRPELEFNEHNMWSGPLTFHNVLTVNKNT